jgi:hypothetical protein
MLFVVLVGSTANGLANAAYPQTSQMPSVLRYDNLFRTILSVKRLFRSSLQNLKLRARIFNQDCYFSTR